MLNVRRCLDAGYVYGSMTLYEGVRFITAPAQPTIPGSFEFAYAELPTYQLRGSFAPSAAWLCTAPPCASQPAELS